MRIIGRTAFIFILSILVASCSELQSGKQRNLSPEFSVEPSATSSPNVSEETLREMYWAALKLWADDEREQAIRAMEDVYELDKEDEIPLWRLEEWYAATGEHRKRVGALERLIEIKPENATAYSRLAQTLIRDLGEFKAGLMAAKKAKKYFKDPSTSYIDEELIAEALEGLGEYENALEHYRLYLKGCADLPESDCFKKATKKISLLEQKLNQGTR